MSKPHEIWPGNRAKVQALWRRQWLVASKAQLLRRGFTASSLERAVASGRLHRIHRGVFSPVAREHLPTEGRIAAALLLGGPDACLFGPLAAWELKLTERLPPSLTIAVRHTRRPADGITWHQPKLRPDEICKPGPFRTTTPLRTALDCAVTATLRERQRLLAQLEFHHAIHADAVLAHRRQGHPGARRLHEAAAEHLPQLATDPTALEEAFLDLLLAHGLQLPVFQHPIGGTRVDAVYLELGLVIELDGLRAHAGERRILADHRRDLDRRLDGLTPLRYHFAQVTADPERVVADLVRAGVPQAQR